MSKIRQIIKLILVRLKVLVREQSEYFRFKQLKFIESVKLDQVKVKAHIIGCGSMGRHIAQVITSVEGWEIVSVFDKDSEMVSRIANQLNKQFEVISIESFLKGIGNDDLLIIATTANSHFEITEAALKLGIKKIFLEKPVCVSINDANTLIKLQKERSALVYVDHLRRWTPTAESINRLIQSGSIGKMVSIHYVFGRAGFAMIGSHIFDYFRMITKSEIKNVRGSLDKVNRPSWRGLEFVDPSGTCEARMKSGVRVTIDLSDDLESQQDFFIVFCERGRLEVDQKNGRIKLIGLSGFEWQAVYPWSEMLKHGIAVALFELAKGIPPKCSLVDGKAALEAVIAIHESDKRQGSWIELPLKGDITNKKFQFA